MNTLLPVSQMYCPNCHKHAKDWPPYYVKCGCFGHILWSVTARDDGTQYAKASIVELCNHLPPPLRVLVQPPRYRPEMMTVYSMGQPL